MECSRIEHMFEEIAPEEFVTVVEETRREDSAMHARRMTAIALAGACQDICVRAAVN